MTSGRSLLLIADIGGYTEYMRSIDALIIGRETYDTVSAFDDWPYKGKRVVVLTHRPIVAQHGETTHEGSLAPLPQWACPEPGCRLRGR